MDEDELEPVIMQVRSHDDGPGEDEVDIDVGGDSCAGTCVIPLGLFNSHVRPSEGSRKGVFVLSRSKL